MEKKKLPIPPDSTADYVSVPQEDVSNTGKKLKRTKGLWVLDAILYPVATNLGVFLISVGATYLTAKGGDRHASGKLIFGKTGAWFQKRGEWLITKFKATGMSDAQADMSKMVAFSFIDGSAMAFVIKPVEDKREHIGRWLDKKMGTVPEDDSIYQAEPKQTWRSMLGGRLATCSIVVPTAVALDRTGLNDTLFNNPGKKMGALLSQKPKVAGFFKKLNLDVKELSRIGFFEAFYTSVCTAGLYFSSRCLGKYINGKEGCFGQANTMETQDNFVRAEEAGEASGSGRKFAEGIQRCVPAGRLAKDFRERSETAPHFALLHGV